jgi:hypothetical protein
MSTNLAVALELASAGIPVVPAGVYQQARSAKWQKRPLIDDWQKYATTDREQIRRWWARHPSAVPGIWCGHPDLNFIMLDPDRHGGPRRALSAPPDAFQRPFQRRHLPSMRSLDPLESRQAQSDRRYARPSVLRVTDI